MQKEIHENPADEPLKDPVTGFTYPPDWVSACPDPASRALAASGLGILTSGGRVMKRGYTTGTTAAAACKAAVLSLCAPILEVKVRVPCGISVTVPAAGIDGRASAAKYSGDYPGDATSGIVFEAAASPRARDVMLVAGRGIGRFARDTPRYRKGEPAISPPALQSIHDAISEALQETGLAGIRVELSAPQGEVVASGTLNPRLGITGGISVLGSTGLVEPWDDHVAKSIMEKVSQSERLVITTGRLGLRYSRLLFPDHDVVLAGARLEEALGQAKGTVILCGLPGLIIRFLEPGILSGTGCLTVEELSARPGFAQTLARVFEKMRKDHPALRVVVISREGAVLGDSG